MSLGRKIVCVALGLLLAVKSFLPQSAQARSLDQATDNLQALTTLSLAAAVSLLPVTGLSALGLASGMGESATEAPLKATAPPAPQSVSTSLATQMGRRSPWTPCSTRCWPLRRWMDCCS